VVFQYRTGAGWTGCEPARHLPIAVGIMVTRWHFSDETFNRTAISFDNPDFVDVVIHSYRHRIGNAPGEPRFLAVEQQLARQPKIQVPSIVLYGANDGVRLKPPDSAVDRALFTSLVAREVVMGAGHFLPREKPDVVSSAILKLLSNAR
jgi:pimeloyl-ACP methyl ester carboxylesterase